MRSIERKKPRSLGTGSPVRGALMLLGLAGSLTSGLTSCDSIEPVAPAKPPITDPMQLYRRLTLDHRVVALSTESYPTVQLTATPYDALGSAMANLPAPTFRILDDTTKVDVSSNGLVTALGTTSEVRVEAALAVGPVTHTDTVRIQVTDLQLPPHPAIFSIHPVPPEDSVWGWVPYQTDMDVAFFNESSFDFSPRVTLNVTDADGAPIVGLPVLFTSLNPDVATIDPIEGTVKILQPGYVRLVAETMAYGTVKADTVTYTVTQPILQEISVQLGLTGKSDFTSLGYPGEPGPSIRDIRLAPSGMVLWYQINGLNTVDVIFDDSTNVLAPLAPFCVRLVNYSPDGCGGGNVSIPTQSFYYFTAQMRRFPVPGIYPYHSTQLGISGRVIVTADPTQ